MEGGDQDGILHADPGFSPDPHLELIYLGLRPEGQPEGSKYPPAKPEALTCSPLKAAGKASSESVSASQSEVAIGFQLPMPDSDCDTDPDSDRRAKGFAAKDKRT